MKTIFKYIVRIFSNLTHHEIMDEFIKPNGDIYIVTGMTLTYPYVYTLVQVPKKIVLTQNELEGLITEGEFKAHLGE